MFRSLKARLAKLENKRSEQGSNRTLLYDPASPDSKAQALSVGKPGKYLLASSYASESDWANALFEQQCRLQAEANLPTQ